MYNKQIANKQIANSPPHKHIRKQNKQNQQKPTPPMERDMASIWGLWQPLLDCAGSITSSGVHRSSSYLPIAQFL